MLEALRITNLAVVEEVEVGFGPGLTVLTGETGAGKSILVDAVGLLLGGRADAESIRAGADEASVEGVFAKSAPLAARLEELGLPDLGDQVCVRRVLGRAGRGKAYVNGALVTVGVLARVLKGFIDIAGQHEHVALFDPAVHREALDRAGELTSLLVAYQEAYAALQSVKTRQSALGGDDAQIAARREYLRFHLTELEAADFQPGEDARLEEERRRLMSVERLRRCGAEAESLLTDEDGGALERVRHTAAVLQEAVKIDGALGASLAGLTSAQAELEEAARALGRYLAVLEGDPQRLADVDERLDLLKRLCRKHALSFEALLQKRGELARELDALDNRGQALKLLGQELRDAEKVARTRAEALSAARTREAKGFSEKVVLGLRQLAMPAARFEVSVTPEETLGANGGDSVEFLFGPNPGEPLRPIAKAASGGEASRLLLVLKQVLSEADGCGCSVLDEIDAGVSGAVADVVGRMIREVASRRQVLCITHLPQVAAYADAHLVVSKRVQASRTLSQVTQLEHGDPRTRELARMLSGVEVTREALGAAEALVRAAHRPVKVPATPSTRAGRPPVAARRLRKSA